MEDSANLRKSGAVEETPSLAALVLHSAAQRYMEEADATRSIEICGQAARSLERGVSASPAGQLGVSFMLAPRPDSSQTLSVDRPERAERFEAASLQGDLATNRTEITLGETVEVVLRLVNAGRSSLALIKVTEIESAGIEDFEVMGGKYRAEEGEVNFKGHRLDPYETLDIRMKLNPSRAGEFTFCPRVMYLGENGGQYLSYRSKGCVIRVFSAVAREGGSGVPPEIAETAGQTQFKGPAAETILQSLVSAFIDDYMVKNLYLDQAGWRSLTKVSEATGIPHASLYGRQGRYGHGLHELLSRGLVETRVFTGQRGRGGEVIKMRIAYGKEPVRRYVDGCVMRPRQRYLYKTPEGTQAERRLPPDDSCLIEKSSLTLACDSQAQSKIDRVRLGMQHHHSRGGMGGSDFD